MNAPSTPSQEAGAGALSPVPAIVHMKIGQLTRQLHDSLNALGFADKLRDSASELPDAKSRLSYIARLTNDAAEKVLNRVEMAKANHEFILNEARAMVANVKKDPVAAVASGRIMNFLEDMERTTQEADNHLTEIMMAQDFHDLTGQVIARVVSLTASIEDQLLQLLIQTAPPGSAPPEAAAAATAASAAAVADAEAAVESLPEPVASSHPRLNGPVVDSEKESADVVTSQSEVDDLLASLGF